MFPGIHAASAPNRPAVVMAGSGKTLTYRELDDNSARLASALHALGLRPGDVIALVSDNSAEAFEVYWAALRSGLYITAVNWHLAPEEAAYISARQRRSGRDRLGWGAGGGRTRRVPGS